ncbi:MAG: enoyl-CoA hydratase/isomerase family protein [Methanomassiliicoccales archaeon]|nr:MAG: enoyl-CoA hydratase/isomerase family protein [Methanomassiliicoccales archaeon]
MQEGNILTERKDSVLIVTLNRPKFMNALNLETLKEGRQILTEVYFDPEIRAVIITGAGEKAFCAGADLKEREKMSEVAVRHYIKTIRETLIDIENLSKPVICAVNGAALGGGTELAMASDIRIAAPNATFGLTEVTLGIIPAGGGTQRLPRLVGIGKAKELILTGRRISAEEALSIGLINKIAPEGKLLDVSLEMALSIAKNAPFAVQQAKFAINHGYEIDIYSGLALESKAYDVCIPTKDRVEALKAFKEKRKPVFKGE